MPEERSTDTHQFDHKSFEIKWQKAWEEHGVFKLSRLEDSDRKLYILDMFPYPSGSGLHVGHPLGYTATDILARFRRMQGYKVLHPMGFDSFGLPAEQHAIATGEHPAVETNRNCERFKFQLKRLGFAYDWSREIRTSDPSYYKWTQYIFTLLYNSYFDETENRAKSIDQLPVPVEVQNRGPLAVQEYQDRFRLAYLDYSYVNFCPELGTILANEEVIDGKSERGGYDVIRVPFKQWVLRITKYARRLLDDLNLLDWPTAIIEQQRNWIGESKGHLVKFFVEQFSDYVECFTTRLDTLPGVTFLAVAPETAGLDARWRTNSEVQAFLDTALRKNERERAIEKSKGGVNTGLTALNPLTNERVPIYIAEYVIAGYGSGVVMGVPAHDERDFEFAKVHGLPIKPVVFPGDGGNVEGCFTEPGVVKNLKLGDTVIESTSSDLAKEKINSYLSKFGVCKESVSYKLRDWIFSRQRYWGEPIPVIHWEDGLRSVLSLEELPLVLPDIQDFKPAKDGQSPLAKATDWLYVTDPATGKRGVRDTNTMPQWAGSCWYYLRFIDPHNESELVSKSLEQKFMPVDLYVGGAEHAVLHLLYARFWHKFLYDMGLVSTVEPFRKLFNQGMILSYAYKDSRGAVVPVDVVEERGGRYFDKRTGCEVEQIVAKMSKSLRNVVDPLEIVEMYGADTLRLYLMFMGPLEDKKIWNTQAVSGVHRFLKRVFFWVKESEDAKFDEPDVTRRLHKLVRKVTEDTEKMRFNTAIASMMEFLNFAQTKQVSREIKEKFVLLLSPYAPHVCEELWHFMGHSGFILDECWPEYDESLVEDEVIDLVVQVNGRKRATIQLSVECTEEQIVSKAMESLNLSAVRAHFIARDVSGKPKLINLVT